MACGRAVSSANSSRSDRRPSCQAADLRNSAFDRPGTVHGPEDRRDPGQSVRLDLPQHRWMVSYRLNGAFRRACTSRGDGGHSRVGDDVRRFERSHTARSGRRKQLAARPSMGGGNGGPRHRNGRSGRGLGRRRGAGERERRTCSAEFRAIICRRGFNAAVDDP